MPYEQRSLRLDGQRRCLRLEPEFWSMLERIARQEQQALPWLIDRIDRHRQTSQRYRVDIRQKSKIPIYATLAVG